MLLPLSLLMKARISTKQKIGLACMFSLGLIVIAFAFVRFREIKKVSSLNETDEIVLVQGPVRLTLWSQIEAAMSLLITNIPAFRSLIAPPGSTPIHPARKYSGRPSYPERGGGVRLDGGLEDAASQMRVPKRHLCRASFEMDSLHSESSVYGSRVELGEEPTDVRRLTLGIVRTTEVDVDSHFRGNELFVSHPFVPPT
ncbi:hypothetical protein I7I50_06104 [Histoplasma capsulatum G186AR]|nr:hypothetical protein I7I52_08842 [Histoplasma capsulatum]QSS67113.1 hypothetical protein I7I50_06104 [Histoplasma capsulatum G186AR]